MKDSWIILCVVAVIGFLASVFLDRVVRPWRVRRWLDKTLHKYREGKLELPHYDYSIVFDSEGFHVLNDKTGETSPRVVWIKVIRVSAFKRDLFSIDCVCIFFVESDERGLEVHEEMNDWIEFVESLPVHLPGCKPAEAWLQDITIPAFATNLTELFSRPGAPSNSGGGKC